MSGTKSWARWSPTSFGSRGRFVDLLDDGTRATETNRFEMTFEIRVPLGNGGVSHMAITLLKDIKGVHVARVRLRQHVCCGINLRLWSRGHCLLGTFQFVQRREKVQATWWANSLSNTFIRGDRGSAQRENMKAFWAEKNLKFALPQTTITDLTDRQNAAWDHGRDKGIQFDTIFDSGRRNASSRLLSYMQLLCLICNCCLMSCQSYVCFG